MTLGKNCFCVSAFSYKQRTYISFVLGTLLKEWQKEQNKVVLEFEWRCFKVFFQDRSRLRFHTFSTDPLHRLREHLSLILAQSNLQQILFLKNHAFGIISVYGKGSNCICESWCQKTNLVTSIVSPNISKVSATVGRRIEMFCHMLDSIDFLGASFLFICYPLLLFLFIILLPSIKEGARV